MPLIPFAPDGGATQNFSNVSYQTDRYVYPINNLNVLSKKNSFYLFIYGGFNMKKTTLLTAALAGFSFSGIAMAEVFSFIEMPLTASQEA